MVLQFVMLAVGGLLLGGAWSFRQQKHPWWLIAFLLVMGLLCVGVSLWAILLGDG